MELDDLPTEVLVHVLSFVTEAAALTRMSEVARRWRGLAEADALWRELFRRRWCALQRAEATASDAQDETVAVSSSESEGLTVGSGDDQHGSTFEAFARAHKPLHLTWKVASLLPGVPL